MSPPFLNLFPLADEITTGLIDLLGVMFGVCAGSLRDAEASRVAPAVVRMKSRRFMRKQLNEGLRASNELRDGRSSFLVGGGETKLVSNLYLRHDRQREIVAVAAFVICLKCISSGGYGGAVRQVAKRAANWCGGGIADRNKDLTYRQAYVRDRRQRKLILVFN